MALAAHVPAQWLRMLSTNLSIVQFDPLFTRSGANQRTLLRRSAGEEDAGAVVRTVEAEVVAPAKLEEVLEHRLWWYLCCLESSIDLVPAMAHNPLEGRCSTSIGNIQLIRNTPVMEGRMATYRATYPRRGKNT